MHKHIAAFIIDWFVVGGLFEVLTIALEWGFNRLAECILLHILIVFLLGINLGLEEYVIVYISGARHSNEWNGTVNVREGAVQRQSASSSWHQSYGTYTVCRSPWRWGYWREASNQIKKGWIKTCFNSNKWHGAILSMTGCLICDATENRKYFDWKGGTVSPLTEWVELRNMLITSTCSICNNES